MMKLFNSILPLLLSSLVGSSTGFNVVDITDNLEAGGSPLALHYQINEEDPNADGHDTISIMLEVPFVSWVGVAFGENRTEAVIGIPGGIHNNETESSTSSSVMKYQVDGVSGGFFLMENQTLIDESITQTDTNTTLYFTKILIEPNEIPIIKNATNSFVALWGSSNVFGNFGGAPFAIEGRSGEAGADVFLQAERNSDSESESESESGDSSSSGGDSSSSGGDSSSSGSDSGDSSSSDSGGDSSSSDRRKLRENKLF